MDEVIKKAGIWRDPYADAQCQPDKSLFCGWHGAGLGGNGSAVPLSVGGMRSGTILNLTAGMIVE